LNGGECLRQLLRNLVCETVVILSARNRKRNRASPY
jgi:hypothetical protein